MIKTETASVSIPSNTDLRWSNNSKVPLAFPVCEFAKKFTAFNQTTFLSPNMDCVCIASMKRSTICVTSSKLFPRASMTSLESSSEISFVSFSNQAFPLSETRNSSSPQIKANLAPLDIVLLLNLERL